MDAYERFNKCIFQWDRALFRFVGHDILVGEFKRNIKSYIVYVSIVALITTEVYTIINYDDLFDRVFCMHISLYTVQCLVKLHSLHLVEDIQWVINSIQGLYKVHITSKSPERQQYFHTFALVTEYIFKFLVVFYVSMVTAILCMPIFLYITQDVVMPIMPLYIPGIDEKTTTGYIILAFYHIHLNILSLVGVLATDYFLTVTIISTLIFAKLITLEIQQIHAELNENSSSFTLKMRFRNILQMHREFDEYMACIDNLTFKTYFGQVVASAFGIIVLVYVVLVTKFVLAFGLISGLLIFIFIACVLGNFVEITHDQIYDATTDLRWNELPLNEQKMYQLLIQRCQNPTVLTVGGFLPLNLDTCLEIFSRIYNTSTIIYTMVG